jgi:acyl carrier protein
MSYRFYTAVKRSIDHKFYSVLIGLNNEVVYTQETVENKSHCVQLLQEWFPGVEIQDHTGPIPTIIINVVGTHPPEPIDYRARVLTLLKEQTNLHDQLENPSNELDLINDLGLDSLDCVELIMSIEEEFKFEVSEAASDRIRTFGELLGYVQSNGKVIPIP